MEQQKPCEVCGQLFTVPKKRPGQRTCGNSCGRKLQWRDENYRQYQSELTMRRNKDPEFTQKRNEALLKTINHFNSHREDYPDGVERHRESARVRMIALNNDLAFKEAHRLRMIERNKDPQFSEKRDRSSANSIREINLKRSQECYLNYQKLLYNRMLEELDIEIKYNHRIVLDVLEDIPNQWFLVDITIPEYYIAIEVDGWIHNHRRQVEKDKKRDYNLSRLGWTVLRIKNEEVIDCIDQVIKQIKELLFTIDQKRCNIE